MTRRAGNDERLALAALTWIGEPGDTRLGSAVRVHGPAKALELIRSGQLPSPGQTGDGYRYDHAFCTRELAGLLVSCEYIHQPRANKLSDHSALTLSLNLAAPQALNVSDPAAADELDTLF